MRDQNGDKVVRWREIGWWGSGSVVQKGQATAQCQGGRAVLGGHPGFKQVPYVLYEVRQSYVPDYCPGGLDTTASKGVRLMKDGKTQDQRYSVSQTSPTQCNVSGYSRYR